MRLVETPSSTFHNTCQYSNVVLLTTKSRPKKSVEVKLFTVEFFGVRRALLMTLGAHFCHLISSHHHIYLAITFNHILHTFQA